MRRFNALEWDKTTTMHISRVSERDITTTCTRCVMSTLIIHVTLLPCVNYFYFGTCFFLNMELWTFIVNCEPTTDGEELKKQNFAALTLK